MESRIPADTIFTLSNAGGLGDSLGVLGFEEESTFRSNSFIFKTTFLTPISSIKVSNCFNVFPFSTHCSSKYSVGLLLADSESRIHIISWKVSPSPFSATRVQSLWWILSSRSKCLRTNFRKSGGNRELRSFCNQNDKFTGWNCGEMCNNSYVTPTWHRSTWYHTLWY